MDEIRDSVSRLKKKLKHRPSWSKRESGAHGESVDPAGPPPRAEPHIIAGGRHDLGGSGSNTDGRRVLSTDPPPQPEDDQEMRKADIEIVMESGRGRDENDTDGQKVEQTHPSPSTALIPHSGKLESKRARSFWLLPLIILANNAGTSIRDRVAVVLRPNKIASPSTAADEKKPSWKSKAFAAVKLLFRGVRDTADAFGPLKSVAGGLCFILENYEVRFPSTSTTYNTYRRPSKPRQISKR